MNSLVEVRSDYIVDNCRARGVEVRRDYQDKPVDFATIINRKGDMASVSASKAVYEPKSYNPKWTKALKKWAKAEGFTEDQIKNQNLIRNVTLDEAVEFLT